MSQNDHLVPAPRFQVGDWVKSKDSDRVQFVISKRHLSEANRWLYAAEPLDGWWPEDMLTQIQAMPFMQYDLLLDLFERNTRSALLGKPAVVYIGLDEAEMICDDLVLLEREGYIIHVPDVLQPDAAYVVKMRSKGIDFCFAELREKNVILHQSTEFDPMTFEGRRAMEKFVALNAGYAIHYSWQDKTGQVIGYYLLNPEGLPVFDGEIYTGTEPIEPRKTEARAWADLPAWADDDPRVREVLQHFECWPSVVSSPNLKSLKRVFWLEYQAIGPTYAAAAMSVLCQVLMEQSDGL